MTTTPETSARSRTKRPLIYVGLVLWVALGLTAMQTLRDRRGNDGAKTDGGPATDPNAQAVPLIPDDRTEPPQPRWNPDGIADFTLTERSGRTVTKRDLLGKPWVACFVFSRCALTCPAILKSMHDLQRQLQDVDVRFVTFTVDPKHDVPEVLDRMAETYGADPERWWFLTGEQATIYGMIMRDFQMPVKEMLGADRQPGFEIMHSNNVMHVDAQGRVVGKYNGTLDSDMAKLRRTLRGEPVAEPKSATDEGPAFRAAPAKDGDATSSAKDE